MPQSDSADFFTQKGYALRANRPITGAMEDYLEMICRLSREEQAVRISALARRLHVRASSASKMARALQALDLVNFEPYGLLRPTEEGSQLGEYLLHRHEVLHAFFLRLGVSGVLEQVELVEHSLQPETVRALAHLTVWMEEQHYVPPAAP